MGVWNEWTALAAGLLIGASLGMLLTALLTISSRSEPSESERKEQKAESLDPGVLGGDDATALSDTVK